MGVYVLHEVVLETHSVDRVDVSVEHVGVVGHGGATHSAPMSHQARLKTPELCNVRSGH